MTPPRVYKPFLKNVSRSGKIRRGKCESAPGQGEHMPWGRGRGDEGEHMPWGRGRGDEGEHKASPLLWTASHAGAGRAAEGRCFPFGWTFYGLGRLLAE